MQDTLWCCSEELDTLAKVGTYPTIQYASVDAKCKEQGNNRNCLVLCELSITIIKFRMKGIKKMKSLKDLVNVKADESTVAVKKGVKIKITALTREQCKGTPELIKFFRHNNMDLDRFHIPEISAETYNEVAKEFKRTARFNERNLTFATATEYYKRKARIMLVAKELGVNPSDIDTKDYYWDERYYTCRDFYDNVVEVEDAWKDGEDRREFSAKKVYINMEPKQASVNKELYEDLYKFCYTAIVNRKAMLCSKVKECLGFLISLSEYTNGLTENATCGQVATLRSYAKFFIELLSDKSAKAFISSTNDVEVYASCEYTKTDYVETYKGLLALLNRGGEFEYFRKIMSKVADTRLDEILTNPVEEVSLKYAKA